MTSSTPTWTPESHLGPSPFLKRVYAASTAEESRQIYDEWASQYDQDLEAEDYAYPKLVTQALVDATSSSTGEAQKSSDNSQLEGLSILDAGCGTGLIGVALSHHGAKNMTGLDISPGMLDIARKTGVYSSLEEADLSRPLKIPASSFDAVLCVGTLTRGHVGPVPILEEFVRVVKKEGVIVATVLDDVWESAGFKAEVERLKDAGKLQIARLDIVGVRASSDTGARLLVLRKS